MPPRSGEPIQKSALNIVMGAMTFGAPGTFGARVHDVKDVEAILDVFRAHGHTEIDTASVYAAGTSEEYLGKINWKEKGLKLETKLYPAVGLGAGALGVSAINHTPECLRKYLLQSLKALNADSIEMWYLHGPDRTLPYEVTLKAVDELYKEGYFKRFGISNYTAWEVAEIVGICKANGYIQPTVYQGIYNAIHRAVEPELFPCLRKFGISFYGFNPLGGGFFIGRYWKDPYFEALSVIRSAAEAHKLTLPEVALRWVSHHSYLGRDHGDAVLIGASSLNHIEQNLLDLEKGPLPDEVVKALDEAWLIAKPHASSYFH
ncbi:hypothetical protein H0H81_010829 [Sphagnurus paluster]|uniref:NADP-dependent oxidoreductase domain-containing protein n=1 Tax=Sphagnurus paluster TaxID=117069 RepID=A0A9P7G311_9AGAR|nr:hypothetical protein H0H81_010829 [Sphagnurus paluster]